MYDLLIGKNIILRHAKDDDYKSMLENVWGDEEVYKWMLYTPTLTIEDAIKRNERSKKYQEENHAYYIALKDSDIAIGLCAIKEYEPNRYEECGICIGTKYQGLGYGKEVLDLLLDLAFNRLNAIDFRYGYFIDNIKSKRLAEYFNFKFYMHEEFIRPWDNSIKHIDLCLLKKEDYIIKFKSERLYLRKWKLEDASEMFKYASDPDVGNRCGWPAHKTVEDSKERIKIFLERNKYCYAICLNGSDKPIGCIELMEHSTNIQNEKELELGYWLGKPYWGHGYMVEASKLLLDFGFNKLNLNAIWGAFYSDNKGSGRVQEKLGFQYVKTVYNVYNQLLDFYKDDIVNILTKEHYFEIYK